MRADLERFAMEALVAGERSSRGAGRARATELPFLVQVPSLSSVPAHWHDYYELGYVLDGEAQHVVNGARQRIRPGSAFLLSPVDFHELTVAPGAGLRCVNVVIRPELVEDTVESVAPAADEGLPWVVADLTAMDAQVRQLCEEASRRRPGWPVAAEAWLRLVLVELARRCHDGTTGPAASAGDREPAATSGSVDLRRAVRFVERHFREPLTLAQVAGVAHLSPHWFSEQFRLTTGSSFQAYLKQRRLQFARALLRSTDLSVTDVAYAAGFHDLSYFGRAYRSRYGMAPSAQRR
jgi:AraC-like DNA-binding protein